MRRANARQGSPSYCFVVGCPRSGTTALTRLLHAHPEVVVGMERYKTLLHSLAQRQALHEFGPKMFEPRRFFDFRPEDTNVRGDLDRFRRHYEVAVDRFAQDQVRYVGDKLQHDEGIAVALAEQFPEARFVFVYRDLVAVANSYWKRATNPDDRWPAEATSTTAVDHWHAAFRAADRLIDVAGSERVLVVRYETLFSGDDRAFDRLFAWLGVDPARRPVECFATQTADWKDRVDRPLMIDERECALLRSQIDMVTLARFDALAES